MENNKTSSLKDWTPTEVHDWEGKEKNVLVLNYTMECPLACNFCCYNCHPKRDEKMPITLAKRLIREAGELKTFTSVGFTGGEPMLHYDEICELGDELRNMNLPFTIATAGHWGESFEKSNEIISNLKSKGLIRLNLSHDPSHAKFVKTELVANILKAAENNKLPTYVVGTFFSTNESVEKLIPEATSYKHINFINKYVAKVGRAKKRDISQKTYDLDLDIDSLCCYRRVNHDIVVFYDGETYPCCSTFNRDTDGISLGNANDLNLKELWERAEGSLSLRVMKRQGFGKFYELINEYDSELAKELPTPDMAVGPCGLCNKIFSNSKLTQGINSVFERYENSKIDKTLDYLIETLGKEKVIQFLK